MVSKYDGYRHKNLDDYISKNDYYPKNTKKIETLYNSDYITKDLSDTFSRYNSPINRSYLTRSPVNWGRRESVRTQNAFVEPTPEEVTQILSAIHRVQSLPDDIQRQFVEATREIRYFFDGQVRARFGATQHFNAIRCLNDPEVTNVVSSNGANDMNFLSSQLAGEEFFALNRFMSNFPDLADIQWWSVYRNGSWRLDTWNPEGEHLDTGLNGWGNLVGSIIKLNGRVLSPLETIAFYRGIRLRSEREFMTDESLDGLKLVLASLDREGKLPRRYDEQVETAHELGLVDENGRALTYVGRSMITPVVATQRRQRQLDETDPEIRRIIAPTIFG